MKRLITILLIIYAVQLTAQNLVFNTGITKDSTRTLINLAIKIKGESLYRGNSTGMSYLSATWTAANLRNYLNGLYDSIEDNFPAANLTDIRFGMTGRTLRNTYNANLTEMARVMKYQTYPVGSYKIWGQRNNLKIGQYNGDTLRVSMDGGATWAKKLHFTDADSVTVCEIFANGTIIIATEQPHLYKSTDTLTTLTEITLKTNTGSNYTYHTPVNWRYPGDYFQTLTDPEMGYVTVNGVPKEVLMFGNYIHSGGRNGSASVNLYYCVDGGDVKSAYTFKVNRYDDGTPVGNATTGTALGNPAAIWKVSHIHDITWNATDSTFWFCTGDNTASTLANGGIYTFKSTYYPAGDTMNVSLIMRYTTGGVTYTNAPQYKIAGFYIEGDSITWAADVDPVDETNTRFTGVYRSHLDDYTDTTKTVHLWTSNESLVGIEKNGNTIVTGGYQGNGIFVSTDNGYTWEEILLNSNDFTAYSYFKKFKPVDTNGYFLIHGTYNNYTPASKSNTVLFKPL